MAKKYAAQDIKRKYSTKSEATVQYEAYVNRAVSWAFAAKFILIVRRVIGQKRQMLT